QPGCERANGGVQLGFAIERVRRRPPPGRFDRMSPVRCDDQIDADLVQALPELPPGRRAAVAEVEIDRGGEREDLRSLHAPSIAKESAAGSRLHLPLETDARVTIYSRATE